MGERKERAVSGADLLGALGPGTAEAPAPRKPVLVVPRARGRNRSISLRRRAALLSCDPHSRRRLDVGSHTARPVVIRDRAFQRRFTVQEVDALARASGSLEAVAWYGGLDMDVAIDDPEQAWRMVAVLQKPIG